MASGPKRDVRKYGTSTVRVRDLKTCHYCGSSPLSDMTMFCPSCGFPQRGTELEQKRFLIERNKMKVNVNETEASIGIARLVLFGLGVLNGGVAAFLFHLNFWNDGMAQAVVAALYGALGWWAGKKPFPALLAGLVLYLTFICISVLVNPDSLFSGIYLKFIIASSLVYGMQAVKKAERMRKEMEVQKIDLSAVPENPPETE